MHVRARPSGCIGGSRSRSTARCSRARRPEAVAGALGSSLEVAFDRWHEWALRQHVFIIDGKPGITDREYETVACRFAAVGIELPAG